MPNIDNFSHKKRVVLGNKVMISWVEDMSNFDSKLLKQFDVAVNIIVSPTPSGLFRIRVSKMKQQVQIKQI